MASYAVSNTESKVYTRVKFGSPSTVMICANCNTPIGVFCHQLYYTDAMINTINFIGYDQLRNSLQAFPVCKKCGEDHFTFLDETRLVLLYYHDTKTFMNYSDGFDTLLTSLKSKVIGDGQSLWEFLQGKIIRRDEYKKYFSEEMFSSGH